MSQDDTPRSASRRWATVLLVFSLALNLLIVGMVAGWMLSPGGPRGERSDLRQARGLLGEPFVRALPQEDRRALLADALRNRDQLRENRQALARRLGDFLDALEAEEFDEATIRGLLSEQRGAAIRRQEIGEALLIERLSAMSRDERRAYAERLRENFRRLMRRSASD